MQKVILVIDDTVSIRLMISDTLQQAGYTVIEAGDGQEGIERAGQRTVDLVITDMNMPRVDGLGVIRALKGWPQYKRVPILMLTTEQGEGLRSQGRAAGAAGWLIKPFSAENLVEVVRRVLA